MCFSVVLNVAVLRQVLGFFYLSFIIGFLLLKILKLDDLGPIKIVVFSVGTSVALVMFLGFLMNAISIILSFSMLLSSTASVMAIGGLTLLLFLLCYRQEDKKIGIPFFSKMNKATVLHVPLIIGLPVVSIIGALSRNTSIIAISIVVIAVWLAASILFDKLKSPGIFPLIILSVSISLLIQTVLISKYFMGSDIFSEFYVFKLTETRGYWFPPGQVLSYSQLDTLNSILSVTILPTVFTTVTGIGGEAFFKFFYPFVFSLIPLSLYQAYEQSIGGKLALLSAVFYISNPINFNGIEPLSLTRQILAEFFLVLFIFVVMDKEIVGAKKNVLLIIFSAAIIVSHYAIAFILLFYLLLLFILPRIKELRMFSFKARAREVLKPTLITIIILMIFSWYIYISQAPLNQLTNSIRNIYSLFGTDFFSTQSRFQPALQSLSPFAPTTVTGLINKYLVYLEEFSIVIGVLVLAIKPRILNFGSEFRSVAIISLLILILCIVVPNLAPTLNMTRFYSIVIPFLAPFCVLGGKWFLEAVANLSARALPSRLLKKISGPSKIKTNNLILFLITSLVIVTFLFSIGLIDHVTQGYPDSYSLDLNRREASTKIDILAGTYNVYLLDQDVYGARWLYGNMNPTKSVYADDFSHFAGLRGYTLISDTLIQQITNGSVLEPSDYVYLRYLNVKIGLISNQIRSFNTSDLSPVISSCDGIYSSGGSIVYYKP
jgi:uncharacterized membrane protein